MKNSLESSHVSQLTFLLLGFLLLTVSLHGENFIGFTTSSNRLVVGTNEAIIIDRVLNTRENQVFIHDGMTNTTDVGLISDPWVYPRAIVGPCELVLTNQAIPVFIQYRRVPKGGFQSILVPILANSEFTVSLPIPAGKSLRCFNPASGSFSVDCTKGAQSFTNLRLQGGEQLDGPMTITLRQHPDPILAAQGFVSIFTYYFTESAFQVPEGVVAGPTGGFDLAVEKSTDLTNWFPIVLQPTTADTKAFYRLRVTR